MRNKSEEVALAYLKNNNDEKKTAQELGLKESSVRRYLRDFREEKKPKKFLLLDIEVSQIEVKTWGLYKQRIPHHRILKPWFIICYEAKWLYDDKMLGKCVTQKEAIERNDTRLLKSLYGLLEEADIVCGHNVARFDLRKINSRLIHEGYTPPTPYQVIDTLKQSQKHFATLSHKQDYLTKYLNLPNKLETNIKLWDDCENGDKKALDNMFEYCKHDVLGLEELYLKVRPWMSSHPTISLFEDTCPVCGSDDIEKKGTYATLVNNYDSYRCGECGHISRMGGKKLRSTAK